ncbi:MAG: hypothetical protein ACXWM8_03475 [Candidatus Limnocylindrales bacterium]
MTAPCNPARSPAPRKRAGRTTATPISSLAWGVPQSQICRCSVKYGFGRRMVCVGTSPASAIMPVLLRR